MTRSEKLKNAVIESLNEGEQNALPQEIVSLGGFSGQRYRKFANTLLSKKVFKTYLEIGVYTGSTSISALYGNVDHLKNYVLMDNFSEFGGSKDTFVSNWKRIIGTEPNLIDADCFSFDPVKKGITDVDVFLYDGEHTETTQYLALKHYIHSMSSSFVFIVDDWRYAWIRSGTQKAITELGLKVVFNQEFDGLDDRNGWWNGCSIFVLEK